MNKLQMIKKIARLKLAQFESTNFVYNLLVAGFNHTPFKELGRTHKDSTGIIVPVVINDGAYDFLSVYFQIKKDDSFDLVAFYKGVYNEMAPGQGFRYITTKYGNKDSGSVFRNMKDAYKEVINAYDSYHDERRKKRERTILIRE
jgi:hypothetical protein